MEEYVTTQPQPTRFILALWAGVLAGPLAFLCQLQINYVLVPWACTTGHRFVLHLVSLFALLIVLSASFIAWRIRGRLRDVTDHQSGGPVARSKFMAGLGLLTSALFLLLIIAQEIPNVVMNPCQP